VIKLSKLLVGAAILLLGLIVTYSFWNTSTSLTYAPSASFTTITGKKIELAKLQGKPVIVTFWATDCENCIKEIPHLIDLHQQFHSKGLEIIAIAMYYDPPNHVVTMAKAKQIPYDVALDLKAKHAKIFGHIELTPSTFLISSTGRIVMQKTGLFDMQTMKQKIESMLSKG